MHQPVRLDAVQSPAPLPPVPGAVRMFQMHLIGKASSEDRVLSFHPLKVAAVDRAAEDAVCVTLAIPPALREQFHFEAGQYVTVRRMIDGREERRTYSIVTAAGQFRNSLGRARTTGRSDVARAGGPRTARRHAGGGNAGRTVPHRGRPRAGPDPMSPSPPAAASRRCCPSRPTFLRASRTAASRSIYGNRSMARTMFLEDTLALKNRYLGRFSVHFVMSREPQHTELLNGRIDAAKIRGARARDSWRSPRRTNISSAVPGSMVDEVREAVKVLNDAAPVRFERFAPTPRAGRAAADRGRRRSRTRHRRDRVPAAGGAVDDLDRHGRQAPQLPDGAARMPRCSRPASARASNCRSRAVRASAPPAARGSSPAKAVMAHNIALEPWEIDAGFVLCCQARPTTRDAGTEL